MHTANWFPAAVYPREGGDGNDIVEDIWNNFEDE